MATADIRVDDEVYNYLLPWIAAQNFAKNSRHFVPQVNLNSRSWNIWYSSRDDDDDSEDDNDESNDVFHAINKQKNKPLNYTPSFGNHYFWYKGRLLLFKRTQTTQQQSFVPISEREEISISSFGRSPAVLKQLLDECRAEFMKNDENRTLIYRGTVKPGTTEPVWTRCMSRLSRPFSTVVLDEAVKQSLLDDMQDYLNPLTRRWYGNRGIPYRRGYLLYGPPGTGKSSLSFAVAGYFKLKIYIVSLNSLAMNEENLGTLFADLPKRCVVLLEDIDTAGLTHTRQTPENTEEEADKDATKPTLTPANGTTTPATTGRISLSALLNVIDGVASQEGRVLIMTTNHIEKLDEALIRPGRVDMTVRFSLADTTMVKTLFKGIFATMEGDLPKSRKKAEALGISRTLLLKKLPESVSPVEKEELEKEEVVQREAEEARISALADKFADIIPSHTFSPAEIQGFLLKHKRNADAAVAGAGQWIKDTIAQKEKTKQLEKERQEKEAAEAKEKETKEKEAKEAASKTVEETTVDSKPEGIDKAKMVNGIDKGHLTNGVGKEKMVNGIGIDEEALTNGIETA